MLSRTYVDRLNEACNYVKGRLNDRPDIGIILGSGLGSYGDELQDAIKIPYKEIPQMLDTTVPGHSGCLIYGKIGGKKVLCLSGRSHQYEGLYPHEVQFAIRILIVCGCRLCILTNAAGTRDPDLNVGDLSPIFDHMNFTHRGYTEESLQQKPFDHLVQTNMYDAEAQKLAHDIAAEQGFQTKGCCYVYNFGPTYETKTEVEGEFKLGGTNFGMSTVPEVVAAKELGVPILAMSFSTNKAAGVTGAPLTHEEVALAAKAGEPKMKKLITEFISRYQVKEFPVPVVAGDDFNLARPRPAAFATEAEIAEAAKLFGTTRIDSLIVLNGAHKLAAFSEKLAVKCADLPKFPLMQHANLVFGLGELQGHQVAVVHGFQDLCGPEPHALHYLAALAKALGAHQFLQTFASGAVDAHAGPSVVADVIPFFERPVRCPKVSRGYSAAAAKLLPGVPRVALASYHGPEFPTAREAGGMIVFGADHIALGSCKGLLIAQGHELQTLGIADGAYPAVIKDLTTAQILERCRGASAGIEKLVAEAVKALPADANAKGAFAFAAGAVKAIGWNDTPPMVLNHQEDPAQVAALKAKLPAVKNFILFKGCCSACTSCCKNSGFEALKGRVAKAQQVEVEGRTLTVGELGGKSVAVAVADNVLVRAAAKTGAKIVTVGQVLATDEAVKGEKYVTFENHFLMAGEFCLVGRNLEGTRFPDMSNLYVKVPGLKPVHAFAVIDARETTPAYAAAIKAVDCQVSTQFGPTESVLVRHADGKPIAHIGAVVECLCKEWSVEENVILPALE